MSKSRSRNLYLGALVATIVGYVLFFSGASISTTTTSVGTATGSISSVSNPALFYSGVGILVIAGIVGLVAWIGSLIKVAQLQRWGWFVGMLLFSGIGMLIYIFAGPQTPRGAAAGFPTNAPR